jgi:2,5-diamino-6-(ribosylamino)-4(3H)-pyrimidinone 5'-phosphate reductase
VKVILVGATTICGRISPVGHGSLLDRRRLEEIRDKTHASIMGANTLRLENPEMRGTNGTLPPDRIRSIITQSGSIPTAGKKLFKHGPKPVVFTAKENIFAVQGKLKDTAQVISLPEGEHGLSLQAAIDFLAENGVESLLIEGGAQLNYSALAQGLVDEILLTIMPFISGEQNGPAFADGPECLGDPFLKFELLSCEPVSTGELFLHYRSKRTEG